jgi:hypothetical protein
MIYIVIEFISNLFKLFVIVYVQKLFQNFTYNSTSFKNIKRKILLQMVLYTLPFTISITILILRRSYIDLTKIILIIQNRNFNIKYCYDYIFLILNSMHYFLYPFRLILNLIYY